MTNSVAVNFTVAPSQENGFRGIRVNDVASSWMKRGITGQAKADAEEFAKLVETSPGTHLLGRMTGTIEIALAARLPCFRSATFVTGQTFFVDSCPPIEFIRCPETASMEAMSG